MPFKSPANRLTDVSGALFPQVNVCSLARATRCVSTDLTAV